MESIGRTSSALALALLLGTPAAAAPPAPAEATPAEIVLDADTGRVLHERGADRSRPPASIAKVMTLFLVFDALEAGRLDPSERLTVSRRAAAQPPTRLGLRPGGRISVAEAMRAVAVKSANDAAVVLAERIAGDERRFARAMTAKARALGMTHTTFGNATGLPDRRTRTTARDIARLARAVLREHPDRYALFGRRTLRWKERSYANHNHLLGRVVGVDGIKTGYTAAAGYTLAASAKRGGRRLIAVLLGAASGPARDLRVGSLLERGFADLVRASVRGAAGTPGRKHEVVLARASATPGLKR